MSEIIDASLGVLTILGVVGVIAVVLDMIFVNPTRLRGKYFEGFQDGVGFALVMEESKRNDEEGR